MDRSQFDLKIEGEGLSPSAIDVLDLAELLGSIREAVCETGGISPTEARVGGARPVALALEGIREGSAVMCVRAADTIAPSLEQIVHAIRLHQFHALPRAAHMALFQVSQFLTRRSWTLLFDAGRHKDAVISSESPVPEPLPRRMAGTTTVYGRLTRVGNDNNPSGRIQLSDTDKTLTVRLDWAMAKELGTRLYQVVGLEGEAAWDTRDWSIVEFVATRILPYRQVPLTEAFDALREAAGGAWDGIDPSEYVKGIRGEDSEE